MTYQPAMQQRPAEQSAPEVFDVRVIEMKSSVTARIDYVRPSVAINVQVTDINMSFGSMVVFMVKWALAAVPALIILIILGIVSFSFIVAVLAQLARR